MMQRALPLSALMFLTGCYTLDGFLDDFTRTFCDQQFECDTVEPGAPYATVEECHDHYYAIFSEADNGSCDFVPDEARNCIEAMESLSCDDTGYVPGMESCYSYCAF